jgi:hypothetical protein
VCEIEREIITNSLIPPGKKEALPDQWKEFTIAPIYKKSNKTDWSNYHGTSPLKTSYKILFNILLSRLSPYLEEITGHDQ